MIPYYANLSLPGIFLTGSFAQSTAQKLMFCVTINIPLDQPYSKQIFSKLEILFISLALAQFEPDFLDKVEQKEFCFPGGARSFFASASFTVFLRSADPLISQEGEPTLSEIPPAVQKFIKIPTFTFFLFHFLCFHFLCPPNIHFISLFYIF